ncbi:MAG: UTRA domain-containing protein [Hyphomicrobiaceae bacterium]|nr:UTRA domain-containing protein [Hyphomicrobiaceae bacterium]
MQDEVLRRIHAREWVPGDLIPNESDLAREFGCSRATVNRALQALADTGLLDRRRKMGTRVTVHPVSHATIKIPIIRQEIEERNLRYRYVLVSCALEAAPVSIRATMAMTEKARLLHVVAVHLGDGEPYVIEDRWIDPDIAKGVLDIDFATISANEWLLRNTPFTRGDIAFAAARLSPQQAELLGTEANEAALVLTRTTWDSDRAITTVKLTYAPGYRMVSTM